MKLVFDNGDHPSSADPYVFSDSGRFYMYVTCGEGIKAYSSDALLGPWHDEGIVGTVPGGRNYWAPCILHHGGKYYVYVSCDKDGVFEHLHVLKGDSPLGPFGEPVMLFDRFSIDAHAVETADGIFLFYAEDNRNAENGRIGTRVYVDRLLDPCTPAGQPHEVVIPTMDEEIFMRDRFGDGKDWHTIEGPFWFREGGYQYLMYSGACFQNDSYHIGYASAKTDEDDLTKVGFVKHTAGGSFDPVMIKNDYEEGVGHHSVVKLDGCYYAVYHGRDTVQSGSVNDRTARICRLHVADGVISAERYENRL